MINILKEYGIVVTFSKIMLALLSVQAAISSQSQQQFYQTESLFCSQRVMIEYIVRENECKEFMEKNKQKILQNIITNSLIVNNQKVEINSINQIQRLADQFKPLDDFNQILVMRNKDIKLEGQLNHLSGKSQPINKQTKAKKSEIIERNLEEAIKRNIELLIEEEVYLQEIQDEMKQFELQYEHKLKLSLLEQEQNNSQNQVNSNKNKEMNEEQQQQIDTEEQSSNQQRLGAFFWQNQLDLLKEYHTSKQRRSKKIMKKIQGQIDALENLMNNLRNEQDKLPDLQDIADLMNMLESINLNVEPLKALLSDSYQRQFQSKQQIKSNSQEQLVNNNNNNNNNKIYK